jgi:rhodanese-related sulfurtransferase
MLPPDLIPLLGKTAGYGIFLAIGLAFGAVLEVAGFGDSRKLSAPFYFRDMTVLKVMFSAIVTAMVLIFAGNALGWVDFPRIYVNPTYLWPQIVGGLIMGCGFILGGFCPGTSIVALATLKLDGLFFAMGVFAGVWLFGDTVARFAGFYESGFHGRFILPDLLGVDAGWVVLAIVIMAVGAFAAAGWAEKKFGSADESNPEVRSRRRRNRRAAATLLIGLAGLVLLLGQPDPARRWKWLAPREEHRIADRSVFVHPAELVELLHNPRIYLRIIDVRSESDFNLFHLANARHTPPGRIGSPGFAATLGPTHPNTVTIVTANGEESAIAAYRLLLGHGLLNVYILDGGINRWLSTFPPDPTVALAIPTSGGEQPSYRFLRAVGDTQPISLPAIELALARCGASYPRHIKLQTRKTLKGGCG